MTSFRFRHRSRLETLQSVVSPSAVLLNHDPHVRLIDLESNGLSNLVHHDTDPIDSGYFKIYDEYQERYIYICSRAVGKSRPFLEEFDIKNSLDLIGPKDLHPIVMTEAEVRRFYLVMMQIVIEMAETGVVVECYSCRQAYSTLSRLFVSSRGDERGIDRDRRFVGYVNLLEQEVSKK